MLHFFSRLLSRPTADPERQERLRVFDDIYARNAWADAESVSGPGSSIERASMFRAELEALLRDLEVGSILDAPCGDFNWLPTFALDGIRIIGVDIVPGLIAANRLRHLPSRVRFMVADMVCDRLPRADLILCRDGLVHLKNHDILEALANFRRSGATWLLTTTFVARDENPDIETGNWRPINLERPPFNLSSPTRLIDEGCRPNAEAFRDKRLGLWPCGALPTAPRQAV